MGVKITDLPVAPDVEGYKLSPVGMCSVFNMFSAWLPEIGLETLGENNWDEVCIVMKDDSGRDYKVSLSTLAEAIGNVPPPIMVEEYTITSTFGQRTRTEKFVFKDPVNIEDVKDSC